MSSTTQNAAQKKLIIKLNKAIECLNSNQLSQARTICRNITKTNPKLADAWHILALVEKQSGHLKSAFYAFDKAIHTNASNPNYHYNLAVTCHEAGKVEQAIKAYKKSLNLNPDNPAALDNLGAIYQQNSRFEEALELHKKAISLQPTPNCYNNLGECYRKLYKPELAVKAYQNALKMVPNYSGALKNLGNLYKEMGFFDKANECLQRAVDIEGDANQSQTNVEALWNQATLLLLQGRLSEGWHKYESGIQHGTRTFIDYGYPTWSGNECENHSLLIIGEQGIGDEIMFASCFKDAISRFQQVYIECDPRLVPLFRRTFDNAVIIARGEEATFAQLKSQNKIDCQLPAGSLPRFFRNHQDDFPELNKFLFPDDNKIKYWRDKLSTLGKGLKIGIAWRGGKTPMIIQKRSTPLSLWQSILESTPAQFINLQYGDCRKDIEWVSSNFNCHIHDFAEIDPLKEMDSYAALISSLDMVISIDNSVVHLAGALGKTTWVLIPYIPDWRWQMDSQSTRWYPSLRLFRQTYRDDWSKVFSAVEKELNLIRSHSSQINSPHKRTAKKNKQALLLNDTSSWYHWGCTCTSGALLHKLADMGYETNSISIQDSQSVLCAPNRIEDIQSKEFQKQFIDHNTVIVNKIKASDIIVLNGEGSMHGTSKPVLTLLLLVKIAKEVFGKVVHIINHSCYPEDKDKASESSVCHVYRSIYEKVDSVAVREPVSLALMASMGLQVIQSFDCLPLYLKQNHIEPVDIKKNYIVLSGSVVLNDNYIEQLAQFMQSLHEQGLKMVVLTGSKAYPAREDVYLIERLKQITDVPWQWYDAKNAVEWLRVIGEAQLLISGRFHHSIAAAFLKTPFIALTSNTPKMNGMLQMLSLPQPISTDTKQLSEKLTNMALEVLQQPAKWVVNENVLEHLQQLAENNFERIEVVA